MTTIRGFQELIKYIDETRAQLISEEPQSIYGDCEPEFELLFSIDDLAFDSYEGIAAEIADRGPGSYLVNVSTEYDDVGDIMIVID